MIAKADLGRRFLFFETELDGLYQTYEQRAVKEPHVIQDAVPSDISSKRLLDFRNEHSLSRRLARVPTTQAKNFFQELLVSLLAPWTHPQVVLNGPFDYRFIQMISHFGPGCFIMLLRNRVSAPFGESGKSFEFKIAFLFGKACRIFPEFQ